MARFVLLLPLVLFLSFDPAYAASVLPHPYGPLVYLAVPVLLALLARFAAARIASRVGDVALHDSATTLNHRLGLCRAAVLLWPAAGLYFLGVPDLAHRLLAPIKLAPVDVAAAAFVTLPAYLGWLALYWAQYPAERALREQAMLAHLESALPVRSPPTLFQYLDHHARTGPGIMVLPVFAVIVLRDLLFLPLLASGVQLPPAYQAALYLAATLLVFLFAPVFLVRILRTRRLPPGPLRDRLDRLAARAGVRYRDVLLWHTGSTSANALVTGVFPRLRYVLLSDLLIETLRDEEIEAVFAHELGHIVHRHMAWFAAFLLSMTLLLGWLSVGAELLSHALGVAPAGGETVSAILSLAVILTSFGYLSRRFERQADVYAARALEAPPDATPAPAFSPALPHPLPLISPSDLSPSPAHSPSDWQIPYPPPPVGAHAHPPTHPARPLYQLPPLAETVGGRGSAVFTDALSRVAWVNNIPALAWNFTHGSIAWRMASLRHMARQGPDATRRFDTAMFALRLALLSLTAAAIATLYALGLR